MKVSSAHSPSLCCGKRASEKILNTWQQDSLHFAPEKFQSLHSGRRCYHEFAKKKLQLVLSTNENPPSPINLSRALRPPFPRMQSNVIRKLAGLNKQEGFSAYILIRPILIPNYEKGATENGWPKALREVNEEMNSLCSEGKIQKKMEDASGYNK